jgi:hypothetical protein
MWRHWKKSKFTHKLLLLLNCSDNLSLARPSGQAEAAYQRQAETAHHGEQRAQTVSRQPEQAHTQQMQVQN